jgi:hypothetical protein
LFVIFHPITDELTAVYTSIDVPAPSGYWRVKARAPAFIAIKGLFNYAAYGRFILSFGYIFANFLNAAKEPVKVTPPMKTPAKEATV